MTNLYGKVYTCMTINIFYVNINFALGYVPKTVTVEVEKFAQNQITLIFEKRLFKKETVAW